MEMHQVRYFLAVARTLNFTRAAEQCNVSQPALTRAIRQLEEEFAGPLIRREGKLSHLTDLGQRMVPLMQQCLESALAAKSLATSLAKGARQALALALSPGLDLGLIEAPLRETCRAFPGLELDIARVDPADINQRLQKGKAQFAIAGPLPKSWDRLDTWPLFAESFVLVVNAEHPLAKAKRAGVRELAEEPFILNTACESADTLNVTLATHGIDTGQAHKVATLSDVLALLTANLGIALLPQSTGLPQGLVRVATPELDVSRTVALYGVAGRQRPPAGEILMKLLRARDWTPHPS
jgi:DNA-binding transcriptional LysR family regulator